MKTLLQRRECLRGRGKEIVSEGRDAEEEGGRWGSKMCEPAA